MAKIIFFPSPVDESKSKEIICKGTLLYALKELGIEKEPLSVSINGMQEEDQSLDVVLDDTDIVEVRRLVHGGGDADTKRTLATVVQVAALVAATYFTGGAAAAILIGGSVISGALNKWATDILNAQRSGTQDQDVALQTNSYSAKNASNKARPLSPIPVPIGSHRFAPDINTDYYRSRINWTGTANFSLPYLSSFITGLVSSNGPMAAINSWAIMPANFMAPGLPMYPIKIAPYGLTKKTTALTPSENATVIGDVASSWQTPTHTNFMYNRIGFNINTAFPIVIYHHDPADPYVGRFNLLWSLARIQEYILNLNPSMPAATRYTMMTNLFNGNFTGTPIGLVNSFFNGGVSPDTMLTEVINGSADNAAIPSTMPTNEIISTMLTKYANYLRSLNGGTYTTTPKTVAPTTEMYYYDFAVTQIDGGIPIASQLFNFGFGDLTLSRRFVGSIELQSQNGDSVGYMPIDKTDTDLSERWIVKPSFNSTIGSMPYMNTVKNLPVKSLINPGITNALIPVTDLGTYNFNYFSGAVGQDNFRFVISGRLYSTSSSGFGANSTRVQIQWRWNDEVEWRPYFNPVVTITNANTQTIYISYGLNFSNMGVTGFTKIQNNYLEVRIRKVNYDSSDNTGDKVSELSITDACFYPSDLSIFLRSENLKNAPMNIEGLYTTGLITDSSTTNQYSALVQAKCWVYNFSTSTWSWTFTRNPAFWFLYFARGGFLNIPSLGAYPPPYSPTLGWVNYPGHPDSTELIFGAGLKDEEMDMDAILSWADFCEQSGLYIDMVLKDDVSASEVLERIANIGRASVSYYGGKLSVVVEDPNQVPVCLFGMGNIIAKSFAVNYAVNDPVRKVVAQFTNREDWETDTVESLVPFSSPETLKKIEITMDGVTDREVAQREVNLLAARQFYQRRTYTWKTDIEGYIARRADLVFLSHDSTQYGYSGRPSEFVIESGVVIGIKTGSYIDSTVSYVSIRQPDGEIEVYECSYEQNMIVFQEEYPIEKAPFFYSGKLENAESDFTGSIPEDFVFIADIKETTGKRVRISEVQANQDGTFDITAVDEDPAMWAYEYLIDLDPESFGDSEVVAEVLSFSYRDLGAGQILFSWDLAGAESVQLINLNTGLPIEVSGQYSFSDGEIIAELTPGVQYQVEARPLAYGTPFRQVNKKVSVWPM